MKSILMELPIIQICLQKNVEIDNDKNYIGLKNIGYLFLQSIYNSLGVYDLLR